MIEISTLTLRDLYNLRKSWKDGIKVSVQAQFAKEGLQLRNNETGKDLLFRYNKVFGYILEINSLPADNSEYCYIHHIKAYSDIVDKSKFKKVEFKQENGYIVDTYPIQYNQITMLDDRLLKGKALSNFIYAYVEEFIKYKEADLKAEKVNNDLSFLANTNEILSATKEDSTSCSIYHDRASGSTDIKLKKEGNKMNKMEKIAKEAVDANKIAIELAAKLEVGKVATAQLKKVVIPKLPYLVRGYADSPLFDIALANVVGVAIREYAPENKKAQIVAESMIQSAAVEMVSSFDINSMIDEMLENVDVSKLVKLDKKED